MNINILWFLLLPALHTLFIFIGTGLKSRNYSGENYKFSLKTRILQNYLVHIEGAVGASLVNWIDPLRNYLYDLCTHWENKEKEKINDKIRN